MMFGISFEHLLIAGVVLLIFGPKRLPELGNSVGKAIRNFKESLNAKDEEQKKIASHPESESKKDSSSPDDHRQG